MDFSQKKNTKFRFITEIPIVSGSRYRTLQILQELAKCADVPITQSTKFTHADDMAMATQKLNRIKYCEKCGLQANSNKTLVTAFHLNNRLAKSIQPLTRWSGIATQLPHKISLIFN